MRDSILRVLLSSDGGMAPISIIWIALGGVVAIARHARWVSFIWLPTILVSALFSAFVVPIIFSGGYGLLALPIWGAFPLITVMLLVAKPADPLGGARWAFGLIGLVALAAILAFVPRPNPIDLRLKIVEGENAPVAHAVIPVFVYHGLGGNDDIRLRTDATGTATLRLYYPESGSITLEDPKDSRRNRKIQFEPWTPIVGGPVNGYKLDGKDIIAGNSGEVFTIYWSDKRDVSQRRTEPMYWHRVYGKLETNPATLVLDAESGKFGEDGDFAFSVTIKPRLERGAAEWESTTEVMARGGASLHISDKRFTDTAPDEGYLDRATFTVGPTDEQRFTFFVRTRSGNYGVVAIEYTIYGSSPRLPWGVMFASVRYNPSGSHAVEFDHTKWLNRN